MINISNISKICLYLWAVYFVYSVVNTVKSFSNLQQVNWQNAKNETRSSLGRITTTTYKFVKDDTIVQREYASLTAGINVWFFWGIDKRQSIVDISFYKVEGKDAFFGLRKYGEKPNKITLFLDFWKYNYGWTSAIFVFIIPVIIKKLLLYFNIKFIENENIGTFSNMGKGWDNFYYFIFLITILSILI